MSHLVKQKSDVIIKDLDLLAEACTKVGLKLEKNKKTATYYAGNTTSCDAVITCPNSSYEIALKKNAKGEYEVEADLYCQKLKKVAGDGCSNVFLGYKAAELNEEARLNNWTVSEQWNPELGQMELIYQMP